LIWSASSGRRDQRMVGALLEASVATVVPHDPAPTTVTRIAMPVKVVPSAGRSARDSPDTLPR
jgi:hypothetical protein